MIILVYGIYFSKDYEIDKNFLYLYIGNNHPTIYEAYKLLIKFRDFKEYLSAILYI